MKMSTAFGKMDILVAVPGLPFSGKTFDSQSLGGSETAGYQLSRALAKRGHRVTVFCSISERVHCEDVDYLPISMFQQYAALSQHDVCIVQRLPDLFPANCRARYSALWCHDLAMGRSSDVIHGTAWNYDTVFVLSEFMRAQYKSVYNLPDELMTLTRNGVDLECVQRVREGLPMNIGRNPLSLVYSARPERGLDVLLSEIMPRILKYEPQAKLFLSAYANAVPELADFYAQCDALAARLGDRVEKLGALTKTQLYELYHAAGVYVYPTPSTFAPEFDEISPVHGDTLIETATGPKRIRDLEGKSGFHVYSRKPDGTAGISKVNGVWKTRRNAKVITLRMRPGNGCQANKESTLTLTPDHEVMLRNGNYCQAGKLSVGDRVMACKVTPIGDYVHVTMTGQRGVDAQRIVVRSILGRQPRKDEIGHHKDGDGFNNEPANVEVTNHKDHRKKHWAEKTNSQRIDERKRRSATSKALWNTPEGKKSRAEACRAMWASRKALPKEDYEAWLRERSDTRDMSYARTPEWSEKMQRVTPKRLKTRKDNWDAMSPEERTTACALRSARISEMNRTTWRNPETREKRITGMSAGLLRAAKRRRQKSWGSEQLGENHVIMSIESAPNADTFCMEVEPDHNFIANGIVVHNCISFAEAQACGLPVVSTARGALPETLAPEAGRLITEPVHTAAYYDAFAEATVQLMRDPAAWRTASAAGLARAATLSWDGVAEQWERVFVDGIKAKSVDLATLANHFWHRSDIYAARECLKRLPENDPKSRAVRARIAKDWAFLDQPDGFRLQYERIGSTHDAAVINWAPQEPRYAAVRVWLQKRIEEKRQAQEKSIASGERYSSGDRELSVLDYGCAHGAYATNLLKELPDLRITGVDIDQHGIEMAYGFADQLGVADRWRGVVGGVERLCDPLVEEMTEQYDVVVAQEVIEHVEDPAATLAALEARVKDDGYVYITVPFGPWEYSDYRRYPFRAHLWEFDLHDLYDLLEVAKGKEAKIHIYALSYGQSPETDDPLGWWVVQYRVTPETRGKTGVIDWERKLTLQRPRQTVSAAIIAGPNSEENLHWCLRSLVHVADELVIADCGLSAEALRVIDTYRWGELSTEKMVHGPEHYFLDVKVVPGVDPKTHGFETPRNIALEYCTQDWVLWVDTDEKLLQPQFVTKYLRANSYQGYSIRQHHFAVDTTFEPDLPVRLFRNNKKMQFFGQVHEHPEISLNQGPGRTIVVADVHIPHMGYLIESGRQQRFMRNLPMLEADIKKYPERVLQKHFIMRDHMLLSTYELQHNGGRVTPEIRARAQEVVRLYREHFLGKGHFSNVDPINYYSQAVTLLGEGFDAYVQLSADKIDAKPNGALKARFASMDDYMVEVTRRAREAGQRFESRYY